MIPRQVKRQQLCIASIQVSIREVDVLLLWLNAAEGDKLRKLASSSYECVSGVVELAVE